MSKALAGYVKTMPYVMGVREGVDIRTGVWRDSDSEANVAAVDVMVLGGMVIFGLGFSVFTAGFEEGPGLLSSSGSSLMPSKEASDGCGSESESESSILQIGR